MRSLVSGVFCGRFHEGDPGNWERTGLYRLAICDRGRRHPVWTQAGSDAQSPGSAGPGLPPLAASTGEKKKGLFILFR